MDKKDELFLENIDLVDRIINKLYYYNYLRDDLRQVALMGLFKAVNKYNDEYGVLFSIISIILLFTFFITSANSAIYVLGMFTSRGDLNPKNRNKIVWGIAQGLFAMVFITLGGLQILQRFAIVVSFPFSLVIVVIMVSLMRELKKEKI